MSAIVSPRRAAANRQGLVPGVRAMPASAGQGRLDPCPQRLVGGCRRAGRRERRHRCALLGHLLDHRPTRDHLGRHRRAIERESIGELAMGLLAAVDHRQERHHLRLAAGHPVDEVDELVVRTHREHRWDQRDEQHVAGVDDVLRHQGHAGRAVEDDHVVVVLQWRDQPADPVRGALRGVQVEVEVAVAEVGRDQIELVEVGSLDRLVQGAPARDERRPATLDLGLDAEQIRRRALRIEVPDEGPQTAARREVGDVHRGRRFPDAALDVVGGHYLHRAVLHRARPAVAVADCLGLRCAGLPQPGHPALPRPPRELLEHGSELRARRVLVHLQPGRDLPHGEDRPGGGTLAGHHVGGECVDRVALRLAVLERPEHVLQRLQLLDRAASVARVQHGSEGLQQVAQFLGPLAQVVQVLGRRGSRDP